MFGVYFGKYLTDIGVLTPDTYSEIIEKCRNNRIEVGVLAVNEGMLIDAQANEVNFLQTMHDMKFGDIALSMNYLTEEQLEELLKKQGNGYLQFVQLLTDEGILTLDEIQEHLNNFRKNEKLTIAELDALKRADVDMVVSAYIKSANVSDLVKEYLCLLGRNLIRFVDNRVRFEACNITDSYTAKCMILQEMTGDTRILAGIADTGITVVAEEYCEEDFYEIDEDCLDAAGEFLNVTNGEFLTKLSSNGTHMDLKLHGMYNTYTTIEAKDILILPCYLFGERMDIIVCEGGRWEIN